MDRLGRPRAALSFEPRCLRRPAGLVRTEVLIRFLAAMLLEGSLQRSAEIRHSCIHRLLFSGAADMRDSWSSLERNSLLYSLRTGLHPEEPHQVAVPRDAHDVVTQLVGVGLRHSKVFQAALPGKPDQMSSIRAVDPPETR